MTHTPAAIQQYTTQSLYSDPRQFAPYFAELPKTIPALCEVIQGLLLHDTDGPIFNVQIDKERAKTETNLKYIDKVLAHLFTLNPAPLTTARAPLERVISSCREFALLLCAMLRFQSVPARVRYGFATYTYPNSKFNPDHILVEYWEENLQRWVLVDARTSPYHIAKKKHLISFDIYDVPRTEFMTAGWVFQKCRTGELDPEQFGYGLFRRVQGLWYVRDRLVQDIASLNFHEMLLWDIWGFMYLDESFNDETTGESLFPLLDQLAEYSVKADEYSKELKHAFATVPGLIIPPRYLSKRRGDFAA